MHIKSKGMGKHEIDTFNFRCRRVKNFKQKRKRFIFVKTKGKI